MIRAPSMSDMTGQPESARSAARTIAIGDIHGCATALAALLDEIRPGPKDTIVTIGDHIDRGPDTRGVIDALLELRHRCHLVTLLGNHEEMLFSARSSHEMFERWLGYGGAATLASYGVSSLHDMPPEHAAFLDSCRLYYEVPSHFFIHANYDPNLPLAAQNEDTALWLSLNEHVPGLHRSRKTAVVGHTAQPDGQVLDLGWLVCIDTNCYAGGYLTAIDVGTGRLWRTREPACV